MAELTAGLLTEALHDQADSDVGALRFATSYDPAAGRGAKVFPPTYPMDNRESPYVLETRYGDDAEEIKTVLLDSYAAEANLAEQALLDALEDGLVRLPLLVVETTVHDRPFRLTTLDMPHRCSDAYLRDAQDADGTPFDNTNLGKALRAAALRDATAVYRACPTALVFGTWDSHRGRPELSFKVPRSYTSEIFGVAPHPGHRVRSRIDPRGLLGGRVKKIGDASSEWELTNVEEAEPPARLTPWREVKVGSSTTLASTGHGNVRPGVELDAGGVAITHAYRKAALSLGGLRRLRFPVDGQRSADRDAAGRTVLAALAILADRLAFGNADLALRSGCDLVVVDDRVELITRGGRTDTIDLNRHDAVRLFEEAVEGASQHGLEWDTTPVRFTPRDNLQAALEQNLIEV